MSKSKFFTDAIAEAKVIKETALSNAKLAMAESFAPQVASMLSTQLNEMEDEMESCEDEQSLDELLNSLEGNELQEGDDYGTNMVTGKPLPKPDPIVENDEESSESETEDEFNPELEDETGELGDEEMMGDEEVGELTIDQFKDLIRDVMQELDAPEEEFEPETEEGTEEEPEMSDDEEINLDEILGSGLEEMSSGAIDGSSAAGAGLENLVSQVKQLVAKSPDYANKIAEFLKGLPSGAGQAMRAEATQLAEAKQVIARQSATLKDVNLLNSKLLYVNKIFKAKNLTEGQKTAVVNALDRAKTTKESESIFLTLKESLVLNPSNTKPLHENKGRASRPAGIAERPQSQVLTEDVNFVARMQKLAGIIN